MGSGVVPCYDGADIEQGELFRVIGEISQKSSNGESSDVGDLSAPLVGKENNGVIDPMCDSKSIL